jgi:hypothetical protein
MIAKYERAELDETITLGTLRRVASALNSELVYALIPEKPIEQMRRERAEALARRRVQAVHASMVLEDQAVSEGERERQIAELAEALLEGDGRSDPWAHYEPPTTERVGAEEHPRRRRLGVLPKTETYPDIRVHPKASRSDV